MTGQTAKTASRCACGSMAVRQVNQFVLSDELWWDSEFSCGACGTYLCDHAGPGPAPDDVREALLTAHGPVRLRLACPVPSLGPVMKVLRESAAISLSQARELAQDLSQEGLAGTLPEMEFLKARLQLRGIHATIGR
ncbi:hypothetical protein ACWEJZ_32910 [Streptomyces bacillaris]|uniref:hypothetical protein n=1 Tax=Streptomyces TaxID=1883 RepID=UPI000A093D5C|nr:hypothetical protein [Streptomyces sp. S8]ARI50707.1 hypothetical protein A6E92_00055 [Streptomyces sp. S8]